MKWDKVPVDARQPGRGLSTANPDRWYEYDDALKCHNTSQGSTQGVGYVITRPHGVVGIDLDGWLTGFDNVEDSVRHTVGIIRRHPLMPDNVAVHGLVIHPATGKLNLVVDGKTGSTA